MFLRRCVTSTHRRHAGCRQNWFHSLHPSTSARLCQRRPAFSSSASQGRCQSLCRPGGALTRPLQHLVNPMTKTRPLQLPLTSVILADLRVEHSGKRVILRTDVPKYLSIYSINYSDVT